MSESRIDFVFNCVITEKVERVFFTLITTAGPYIRGWGKGGGGCGVSLPCQMLQDFLFFVT